MVFWNGQDYLLWYAYESGGNWNYTDLTSASPGNSEIAPVNPTSGNVHPVYEGSDAGLWDVYANELSWSTPSEIANSKPLGAAPSTSSPGNGTIKAFWEGLDGNLWTSSYSGSAWSSPTDPVLNMES
jgi:hypothetical protein